jgi:hypothetical protein
VERAQRLAPLDQRVGGVGGGESLIGEEHGDGIDDRVDGVEAAEHGPDRLAARDLAGPDGRGQLDSVPAPQLAFHGVPPRRARSART